MNVYRLPKDRKPGLQIFYLHYETFSVTVAKEMH